VRRHSDSVLAGDQEYSFWHALTREVAYEQLPRATRAAKHAAVARWIESSAVAREEDVADLLAYHYRTAFQLAWTLGQHDLVAELRTPAVRALRLAGDQALQLDIHTAEELYRHAAEIAVEPDPSRASLLMAWTRALHQAGRTPEALAVADEAVTILRSSPERRALAVALLDLSRYCGWVGDARSMPLAEEALRLAEAEGPSLELLAVLEYWLAVGSEAYDNAVAIATADEALQLSAVLGVRPPVKVLHYRGLARCDAGDRGGLADVQSSLDLARAAGLGREVAEFAYNLSFQQMVYQGPAAALRTADEGLTVAGHRGYAAAMSYLTLSRLLSHWLLGEWDVVEKEAHDLEQQLARQQDLLDLACHHVLVALIGLARGRDSLGKLEAAVDAAYRDARVSTPPAELDHLCLPTLLALQAARGGHDEVRRTLSALEARISSGRVGAELCLATPAAARELARTVREAGGRESLHRLVGAAGHLVPSRTADAAALAGIRALGAETDGEIEEAAGLFADAAAVWGSIGVPYERAHALLGRGRCLLAQGRVPDAAAALNEAQTVFARLRARPALLEAEALLVGAGLTEPGQAAGGLAQGVPA
jgi:tetratricopeptide (TPR) repeat protein